MRDPVSDLAEQGKALSPEDRSRLVDLLLVALHELPTAEIEAAWDQEAARRLAAFDRGEIEGVDGEQVLAKARALTRQ
jgi:putative addiction module component (TIGR02574 family)